MNRDGDIIKALGYVTIYAAYLEEGVDVLIERLSKINGLDSVSVRDPVSKKINWCQSAIKSLGDSRLTQLEFVLHDAKKLFEKRNEIIHGRIYAGNERGDNLKSSRANIPTRIVTADELYALAADLFAAQGKVQYQSMFATLEAISRRNGA